MAKTTTKPAKTTRATLGTAGATILHRRTGGEALGTVVAAPEPPAPVSRWGKGRNQAGFKVTTIRLMPDQWMWLRRQALVRAMATGTAADASEILRELVAGAMTKDNGKR